MPTHYLDLKEIETVRDLTRSESALFQGKNYLGIHKDKNIYMDMSMDTGTADI